MARSTHILRTELSRTAAALGGSIRERGWARSAARAAAIAAAHLAFPITRARRKGELFAFRGELLPYTLAWYNNSFLNERTVEISIAKWFLSKGSGRMLELGNVLAHYGVTGHTVLDKYERIPGVLNQDIVEYFPEQTFDTVVAISTLEHVGWDEVPRQPDRLFHAINVIRDCVGVGGRLLVTVPIGYNSTLDAGLQAGEVRFPVESWLVRTTGRNEWVEADRSDALAKRYGHPHPGANGLYIATLDKTPSGERDG